MSLHLYILLLYLYWKTEKKEKKCVNFAKCLCKNTRQSGLHMSAEHPLCRVLKSWHSAKIWKFAECQDPALGKVTTWRDPGRPFCRVPAVRHSAKIWKFAECQTQHSAKRPRGGTLGGRFAECLPLGTRQRCRPGSRHVAPMLSAKALGKDFAECSKSDTRQRPLCRGRLCRVVFAECYTRQRVCRVQTGLCRV